MADILTQLQTCLDQLATQFYATLCYLTTYHDNIPATPPPTSTTPNAAPLLAKIPKNASTHPVPASAPQAAQSQSQASPPPPDTTNNPQAQGQNADQQQQQNPDGTGAAEGLLAPAPDSPATFAARQRELARDLVIKEQQIEYLISVLPGIDSSEAEQERRIRELEGELRVVEGVREERRRELGALRRRLEGVLGVVERGIYSRS
ncbi:RNA polymerase II mediator complex subunit [Aspergillus brasiliensis]|uniref:Mediator of RNA polymerase II transcription subunit 21 n=1 Tax=Aspergillus brasiliensis TaxID=319629 RepID=A0A9W5YZR2_9EURO|nr:RNA polymerase II mediator complex subunit [Aspergillus brasiliensis]GKZ47986.1 RNA polymerase II mediator complex subunit [Aspergillus brasiliensis]